MIRYTTGANPSVASANPLLLLFTSSTIPIANNTKMNARNTEIFESKKNRDFSGLFCIIGSISDRTLNRLRIPIAIGIIIAASIPCPPSVAHNVFSEKVPFSYEIRSITLIWMVGINESIICISQSAAVAPQTRKKDLVLSSSSVRVRASREAEASLIRLVESFQICLAFFLASAVLSQNCVLFT